MRRFLIAMTIVLLSSALAVAHAQCAQMTRSDDTVTVTADTWRPLNAIAQTLANNFGIIISTEDPDLVFTGDLTDTTERALPAWRAAHPNTRVHIPKAWRLQVEFRVRQDGTPEDVAALLQQIVVAANAQSPFSYRLDMDGEFNTFVPTRTRDAAGAVVEKVPLLDLHIDIPAGTRTIAEDGDMLAKALSAQTGLRISCCQSLVAGVPWGMAKVPFEARDEQARSVLERLVRLEQQAEQQSKQRSFSANSNVYWLLSCDPDAIDGPRYCFIDLHPVREDIDLSTIQASGAIISESKAEAELVDLNHDGSADCIRVSFPRNHLAARVQDGIKSHQSVIDTVQIDGDIVCRNVKKRLVGQARVEFANPADFSI